MDAPGAGDLPTPEPTARPGQVCWWAGFPFDAVAGPAARLPFTHALPLPRNTVRTKPSRVTALQALACGRD